MFSQGEELGAQSLPEYYLSNIFYIYTDPYIIMFQSQFHIVALYQRFSTFFLRGTLIPIHI